MGSAGSFDIEIEKGSLVVVEREYFGDTGVEEQLVFKDVFDLQLEDENKYPFTQKALINKQIDFYNFLKLPIVSGITVNEVSTSKDRIELLRQKYNPTIETMEGAALHYVCLQTQTPFLQIRAISNYIGERDKTQWEIKKSIDALCESVKNYLEIINQNPNIIL